ncbi:MAG: hypothetical protein WKG07_04780 [Hymenobacter sp.]
MLSKAPAEARKTTGELPLSHYPPCRRRPGPGPRRGRPAGRLPAPSAATGRLIPPASYSARERLRTLSTKAQNQKPVVTLSPTQPTTPWPERLKLRRHATAVLSLMSRKSQGELNRKLHYALRRLLAARDPGAHPAPARGRRPLLISRKSRPWKLA